MVRDDAKAEAAQRGATPELNVTKRTTVLVIGDGFRGESADEFFTGKAQKAAALLAKGQAIEVLTEEEFVDLLRQETAGGRSSSPSSN